VPPSVDRRTQELYFLLVHFLQAGPCRETAATLMREMTVHGLGMRRIDWQGGTHPRSYSEAAEVHGLVSADRLPLALDRLVEMSDRVYPLSAPNQVHAAPPSLPLAFTWPSLHLQPVSRCHPLLYFRPPNPVPRTLAPCHYSLLPARHSPFRRRRGQFARLPLPPLPSFPGGQPRLFHRHVITEPLDETPVLLQTLLGTGPHSVLRNSSSKVICPQAQIDRLKG